ncbi:MAG: DUF512 domain-containing protein, partial [Candidatus Zixiibacteriota bacterium]
MRVKAVDPQSPLFGYVRPGYTVKAINGKPVLDSIDFRFKTDGEQARITFVDPNGRTVHFDIDPGCPPDLGLTLDDDRVMVCDNNCIFCFVHQQPKGMRRPLYVKDEDYRLSFTHGNFVTLTNVTEKDVRRIIRQRLSPLYVSVHTTDDSLRRFMLQSDKAPPILPQLKRLANNGITVHAQCVICPGINDGDHLEKTITDLAGLYPGVNSLAVVPVGLTRYRQNLPRLRRLRRDESEIIIDRVERRQEEFLKTLQSRFVWAADELYVETGRDFPLYKTYESMPQFENGVGMGREFLTTFNRRRSRLGGIRSQRRVMLLTGRAAYPFFSREILPYVRDRLGLGLDIGAVDNKFWGDM